MTAAEIHLWTASVDRSPEDLARLDPVLTHEERARAARYRFQLHRDRFTAGRAIRRLILARYLHQPPEAIAFAIGPQGKPSIEGEPPAGLRFNDSGSDGLAIFAVTWGRDVGADVERVRPNAEADRIVDRFGTPEECEAYWRLPTAERPLAFHRWWTAKEAWLKAVGTGLLAPLGTCSVSFSATAPLRLLAVGGNPAMARRWTLETLNPAPGFVASLVVEGPVSGVRRRRWRGR